MHIDTLMKRGVKDGLFTDYDVCVEGRVRLRVNEGPHVSQGATLFDIASLTKACVHLVLLKLFANKILSPDVSYRELLPVPELPGDARTLRHFMCYAVQSYNFDHKWVKSDANTSTIRDVLMKGFGVWKNEAGYDNYTSAYIGLLLEHYFKERLETILWEHLLDKGDDRNRFRFHPVSYGVLSKDKVVPTSPDPLVRGVVHDPLCAKYVNTPIAVSGIFTDAEMLARIFHRAINSFSEDFRHEIAEDQRALLGISGEPHGLGFDIPGPTRFKRIPLKDPLLLTGYTGGRIFFARKPNVTVSLLTNFAMTRTEDKLVKFKALCWEVLRTAVRLQA